MYLDSGSNAEIAGNYGVRYDGDWNAALDAIRSQYAAIVARVPNNPFRVSTVGPQYLGVVTRAAQQMVRA
jgi:hypothetical protein